MYYMLLLVLLGEGLLRLEARFSLSDCTVRCFTKTNMYQYMYLWNLCKFFRKYVCLYTSIH